MHFRVLACLLGLAGVSSLADTGFQKRLAHIFKSTASI